MSKIKTKKIFIALLLLFSGMFYLNTPTVLAASEPGCYKLVVSPSNSGINKVTCPSEGLARATSATGGKCFVSDNSDNPDDFKETDCTTFSSNTPGTSSGTVGEQLGTLKTEEGDAKYICGKGPEGSDENEVKVSFNFGCVGKNYSGTALNPIVDVAFALFRFLSVGVGLIVIGSIVIAGIQYTTSRGEPQVTAAAIKRITNSLIALLIYIFMFAILNFLVPGGMFVNT